MTLPLSKAEQSLRQRQQKRHNVITEDSKRLLQISSSWPTVVPDDIVFKCLENYRLHSVWTPPVICSVCGLLRHEVEVIDVCDPLILMKAY